MHALAPLKIQPYDCGSRLCPLGRWRIISAMTSCCLPFRPLGRTLIRNKLLRARGWHVVVRPFCSHEVTPC